MRLGVAGELVGAEPFLEPHAASSAMIASVAIASDLFDLEFTAIPSASGQPTGHSDGPF